MKTSALNGNTNTRTDSKQSFAEMLGENYREIIVVLLTTWVLVGNSIHAALSTNVLMDIRCFYIAAQDLEAHAPLYSTERSFLYLPLIPILLKPLISLGFPFVVKIWMALNLVAYIAGAAVTAFLSQTTVRGRSIAYCGILLILMHNWAFSLELLGLNCDMILSLIFCSLILCIKITRFKTFAVLVAVGTAFKFWFFGVSAYLLLTRRYRAFLLCVATTAVIAAALFQVVGWDQLPSLFKIVRLYGERKFQADIVMQSISGFATTHLQQNAFVKPLVDMPVLSQIFIKLGDALVCVGTLICLKLNTNNRFILENHKLSLVLTAIFLVTPVCHVSYAVVLLPGLALTIFTNEKSSTRFKIVCLAMYIVLTRVQVFMQYGSSRGVSDALAGLLLSTPFFWFIAFWSFCAFELYKNSDGFRIKANNVCGNNVGSQAAELNSSVNG